MSLLLEGRVFMKKENKNENFDAMDAIMTAHQQTLNAIKDIALSMNAEECDMPDFDVMLLDGIDGVDSVPELLTQNPISFNDYFYDVREQLTRAESDVFNDSATCVVDDDILNKYRYAGFYTYSIRYPDDIQVFETAKVWVPLIGGFESADYLLLTAISSLIDSGKYKAGITINACSAFGTPLGSCMTREVLEEDMDDYILNVVDSLNTYRLYYFSRFLDRHRTGKVLGTPRDVNYAWSWLKDYNDLTDNSISHWLFEIRGTSILDYNIDIDEQVRKAFEEGVF